MGSPQAAQFFRQWTGLTEKCSGADASMQAKMTHDIISAPCLSPNMSTSEAVGGRCGCALPTSATPGVRVCGFCGFDFGCLPPLLPPWRGGGRPYKGRCFEQVT